jgi:hypothetical protein
MSTVAINSEIGWVRRIARRTRHCYGWINPASVRIFS